MAERGRLGGSRTARLRGLELLILLQLSRGAVRNALPSSQAGWREFAGEVGIIVIGVLIALGAESVVHDLQTRADARAFRETIDHEIGMNLFIYDVRSRQSSCDSKRVAELKSWLGRARSGKQVPALWPAAPQILTPYRSAWDNRDAQVFNHLPPELRQKYAEFYDELSNNWSIIEGEQERWGRLIPYAEAGPISLADRRAVRAVIAQIRDANATFQVNLPISRKIAEVLKVKEARPDGVPSDWLKSLADCRSTIASPAETAKMNALG